MPSAFETHQRLWASVVTTIENAGTVLREASASLQICNSWSPQTCECVLRPHTTPSSWGGVSHIESVKAPLAVRATSTEAQPWARGLCPSSLPSQHAAGLAAGLWETSELIHPESLLPDSQQATPVLASLIGPKARAGILYPTGSL